MENSSVRAEVIEILPAALYRVKLLDGKEYMCYLAGKLKFHHIQPMLGDEVKVILDPYGGKATNRIIWVKR